MSGCPTESSRRASISTGTTIHCGLEVTIRIRGSEITIDYAGTSAQIDRGINCPLNLTYAESVFPIMAALLPDVPSAEGALRPIHVIAPVGTIVNPAFPAPVRSRVVVVHNVHAAIFRALQPLVPEHLPEGRIQAHSGCIWGIYLWGAAPGPGVRGLMDVGSAGWFSTSSAVARGRLACAMGIAA